MVVATAEVADDGSRGIRRLLEIGVFPGGGLDQLGRCPPAEGSGISGANASWLLQSVTVVVDWRAVDAPPRPHLKHPLDILDVPKDEIPGLGLAQVLEILLRDVWLAGDQGAKAGCPEAEGNGFGDVVGEFQGMGVVVGGLFHRIAGDVPALLLIEESRKIEEGVEEDEACDGKAQASKGPPAAPAGNGWCRFGHGGGLAQIPIFRILAESSVLSSRCI